MIKVEQINLTNGNLLDVIHDKQVYVISERSWDKGAFSMEPISKCEIGTLLSGDVAVVRITK